MPCMPSPHTMIPVPKLLKRGRGDESHQDSGSAMKKTRAPQFYILHWAKGHNCFLELLKTVMEVLMSLVERAVYIILFFFFYLFSVSAFSKTCVWHMFLIVDYDLCLFIVLKTLTTARHY